MSAVKDVSKAQDGSAFCYPGYGWESGNDKTSSHWYALGIRSDVDESRLPKSTDKYLSRYFDEYSGREYKSSLALSGFSESVQTHDGVTLSSDVVQLRYQQLMKLALAELRLTHEECITKQAELS